jgi:parallel beta-helix repeat protein
MKHYNILACALFMCSAIVASEAPLGTQNLVGNAVTEGNTTHALLSDRLMQLLVAFLAENANDDLTLPWVASVLRYNQSVQTGEDLLQENDMTVIAQELLLCWDVIEARLFTELYKAPRQNLQTINNMVVGNNNQYCATIATAVSSSGSGGTCDLTGVITQLEALLALLTSCCTMTNANFQATFTVISDINSTFTACCAQLTTDFSGTWTMLAALQSSADLCGTFTPITFVPQTLSAPGNYCFTQSFTVGANQTGLTVTGTRVYIDFNNYALTLEDPQTSFGIYSSADQTTIANGMIVGGFTGAQGANDIFVATNMTFSGQGGGLFTGYALRVTGTACNVSNCSFDTIGYGVYANNTTALTVAHCTANNPVTSCIYVLNSSSFLISNCSLGASSILTGDGIDIINSTNGFIQNCLLQDLATGIFTEASSNNIVVSDCISNGASSNAGFLIRDSTNIAVIRCQASAGTFSGITLGAFDKNLSGIAVHDCIMSSNTVNGIDSSILHPHTIDTLSIQNCIFSGNTQAGLSLQDTSSSVITNCDFTANANGCIIQSCFGLGIYHNTAANNTVTGFELSTSYSCIHRYNEASNNGFAGFLADDFSPTCTYYNNLAFNNNGGGGNNFVSINGVTGNVVNPSSSLDISSTGSAQQLVYNISTP